MKLSEIRDYEPQFDEKQRILPKQHFCASCKKRTMCDKLYEKHKENHTTNKYAEVVLSMYYTCDDYDPMYIEFPIEVNEIHNDISYDRYNMEKHVGEWCITSLNAEGYDEDLHIGIYLGMLPLNTISLYDRKTNIITNKFNTNPAIFVPLFNKIFYGFNMRWKFIDVQDDIDEVSDKDPKDYLEIAKTYLKNKLTKNKN